MPKKKKRGQPAFYKTPLQLQKKIESYFKTEAFVTIGITGDKKEKTLKKYAPTISGLVLYCGFSDRHSFYDMEKRKEFSHTIKRARERIVQFYERLLQGSTPTGAIFALKNFGWHDEIYHKGDGLAPKIIFQDIQIQGAPADKLIADINNRLSSQLTVGK